MCCGSFFNVMYLFVDGVCLCMSWYVWSHLLCLFIITTFLIAEIKNVNVTSGVTYYHVSLGLLL
jgi:hypothetical protein